MVNDWIADYSCMVCGYEGLCQDVTKCPGCIECEKCKSMIKSIREDVFQCKCRTWMKIE